MGIRASKKADITAPPPKDKKLKRKKSKKEEKAAANGIEEIASQDKKEAVQDKTNENESKVEENGEAKKDTESAASGDAPTDIVQDSPGNETANVAVLSEVQSPTQTSPANEESKSTEQAQTSSVVEAKIEIPCLETENKAKEAQPENIPETIVSSEVKNPEVVKNIENTVENKVLEEKEKVSSPTEAQPITAVAPVETQPAATAPVEIQPATAAPVETQPATAVPVETQPTDVAAAPVETQSADVATVPVETQAADAAASPVETQSAVTAAAPVETQSAVTVASPIDTQLVDITTSADLVVTKPADTVVTAPVEIQLTTDSKIEDVPKEKPPTPEVEATPSPVENVQSEQSSSVVVDEKSKEIVETKSEDVKSPVIEQHTSVNIANDEKAATPVESQTEADNKVAPVEETKLAENPTAEESKSEVEKESTTTEAKEAVQSPTSADSIENKEKASDQKAPEGTVAVSNEVKVESQEKSPTPNEESSPKPVNETPVVQIENSNETGETTETKEMQSPEKNEVVENQTNGITENGSQTKEIEVNGIEANGPTEIPTLISWKNGGNQVAVTGDFNKWGDNCMLNEQDGVFSTKLKLSKGTHHFKFLVDGNLTIDENLPVTELDGHGQVNILTVQAE